MRLQVASTSLPHLIIKKYILLDFLLILTLIIYIDYNYIYINSNYRVTHFSSYSLVLLSLSFLIFNFSFFIYTSLLFFFFFIFIWFLTSLVPFVPASFSFFLCSTAVLSTLLPSPQTLKITISESKQKNPNPKMAISALLRSPICHSFRS